LQGLVVACAAGSSVICPSTSQQGWIHAAQTADSVVRCPAALTERLVKLRGRLICQVRRLIPCCPFTSLLLGSCPAGALPAGREGGAGLDLETARAQPHWRRCCRPRRVCCCLAWQQQAAPASWSCSSLHLQCLPGCQACCSHQQQLPRAEPHQNGQEWHPVCQRGPPPKEKGPQFPAGCQVWRLNPHP